MSRDDADPDPLRSYDDHGRRFPGAGFDDERRYRERYSEKTVRGVTVATIVDRDNEDAWIRSTLAVDNEP